MSEASNTPQDPAANSPSIHAEEPRVEWIKSRVIELQLEHRGLDSMIMALGEEGRFDELQLRRLKKRKLQIKDSLMLLQMQLVPDVPA